jgi:hypothetical protein
MSWQETLYTWITPLIERQLTKKNVVGFGLGRKNNTEELCINILVTKKESVDSQDAIPKRIFFLKTDVREVGKIELTAAPRTTANTKLYPLVGGAEITLDKLSVGTLGLIVPCWKTRAGHILTGTKTQAVRTLNNEGLGMSEMGYVWGTTGITNTHVVGDTQPKYNATVYHPNRAGVPVGVVGTGFDIQNKGLRKWDFALINLDEKKYKVTHSFIHHIGVINKQPVKPKVGEEVHTCGRTTGYFTSKVLTVNSTMAISYPHGTVVMRGCVVTDKGIARGNSGSVFVTKEGNQLHSLIYAGSPTIGVAHNLEWLPEWLGWDLR